MQIYVDADACLVLEQIEDMSRMYMEPVTLLCDASCPAVGLLHGAARGCGQGCRRHRPDESLLCG